MRLAADPGEGAGPNRLPQALDTYLHLNIKSRSRTTPSMLTLKGQHRAGAWLAGGVSLGDGCAIQPLGCSDLQKEQVAQSICKRHQTIRLGGL